MNGIARPSFWLLLILAAVPFSDVRIETGSWVFYPPEIAIYLWALVLSIQEKSLRWLGGFSQQSRLFLAGLTLLILGAVLGTIISPIFPQSVGALKAWFIAPILLSVIVTYLKVKLSEITPAICSLALIWIIKGALSFDPADLTARLDAFYETPNYYAQLIAPLILFLMAAVRFSKLSAKIGWPIIVLLVAGLILTRSIGGLLAAGLGIVVLELYLSRKFTWKLALVVLVSAVVIGVFAAQRLALQNNSLQARLQIWRVGAEVIRYTPVTGGGLRGFEIFYPEISQQLFERPIDAGAAQPHQLLLSFWVNTGLFGFVGAVLLFWWAYRQKLLDHQATWAVLVLFIHGLDDTPYWRVDLAIMFWLYISLLASEKNQANEYSD